MRRIKIKIAAVTAVSAITVLATPALASALTATTTISSVVGAGINLLTTSGTVDINATPNGPGVQTIASDTITVSTNATAGYTLKLNETVAADTTLKTGGGSTIAASTGTQSSPIAMSVNSWGYRVDGIGGFGSTATVATNNTPIGTIKFAAVPASVPDTLKTTSSVATNDTTTVWYAVAVNTSTPSGTYTNSVTYTAITN